MVSEFNHEEENNSFYFMSLGTVALETQLPGKEEA
jgi:hypothetical protein